MMSGSFTLLRRTRYGLGDGFSARSLISLIFALLLFFCLQWFLVKLIDVCPEQKKPDSKKKPVVSPKPTVAPTPAPKPSKKAPVSDSKKGHYRRDGKYDAPKDHDDVTVTKTNTVTATQTIPVEPPCLKANCSLPLYHKGDAKKQDDTYFYLIGKDGKKESVNLIEFKPLNGWIYICNETDVYIWIDGKVCAASRLALCAVLG